MGEIPLGDGDIPGLVRVLLPSTCTSWKSNRPPSNCQGRFGQPGGELCVPFPSPAWAGWWDMDRDGPGAEKSPMPVGNVSVLFSSVSNGDGFPAGGNAVAVWRHSWAPAAVCRVSQELGRRRRHGGCQAGPWAGSCPRSLCWQRRDARAWKRRVATGHETCAVLGGLRAGACARGTDPCGDAGGMPATAAAPQFRSTEAGNHS